MKGRVVLIDGSFASEQAVLLDVSSEALCLGHSLFETMLVRPYGEDGLFRLEAHIERLVGSAERLGWSGRPDVNAFSDWVRLAARRFQSTTSGYGRLRLTALWTSIDRPPKALVTVVPYTPPEGPARVVSTQVQVPWTYLDGIPAPKSGSRLAYSFAEQAAKEGDCDEALLVDAGGNLLEGAKTNLFAVVGERIVTPGVECGILPGIARRTLIELAGDENVPVELRPISREEIDRGVALLLSNSLWGVRPVGWLDGMALPAPDGTAKRLIERFRAQFRPERP